jgi:hypothetical protein
MYRHRTVVFNSLAFPLSFELRNLYISIVDFIVNIWSYYSSSIILRYCYVVHVLRTVTAMAWLLWCIVSFRIVCVSRGLSMRIVSCRIDIGSLV